MAANKPMYMRPDDRNPAPWLRKPHASRSNPAALPDMLCSSGGEGIQNGDPAGQPRCWPSAAFSPSCQRFFTSRPTGSLEEICRSPRIIFKAWTVSFTYRLFVQEFRDEQYVRLFMTASRLERWAATSMSLAKLAPAPVYRPGGFYITRLPTGFGAASGLQAPLLSARKLSMLRSQPPSKRLAYHRRIVFRRPVPEDIARPIPPAAYMSLSSLNAPASVSGRSLSVAVRSASTAEDLPGASFAGQRRLT